MDEPVRATELHAARDLLTGDFRDSYTSLTNDVVIPGAKQKQISAVATVPAAASVSAMQTCWSAVFAGPMWRLRCIPKARTPCESVPSTPARLL